VIVVIKTVRTKVADINIRPAIVVVITDDRAKTPALVGDTGLDRNIGKCAVMIVVKQSSARSRRLSSQGFVSGTVHQIDVEPSIIVVVKQRNTRTDGLYDERFLRRPHYMLPTPKPCLFRDVLKNKGAGVDNSPRCNGPFLRVEHGGVNSTSRNTPLGLRNRMLLNLG
jgi:hypothetical protein